MVGTGSLSFKSRRTSVASYAPSGPVVKIHSNKKEIFHNVRQWVRDHCAPESVSIIDKSNADKICRNVESQTIGDNQIGTHKATKEEKIWAKKYFICRLATLAERYKETSDEKSYEVLRLSHNLWNIYLATKDLLVPPGGDRRDVIFDTMKAKLKRISSKEKYWDIKLLSMACYPEVTTSELCRHTGLVNLLHDFDFDAEEGHDLLDVQGHLRRLILNADNVTETRLRMLKDGLRKMHPDKRGHWPLQHDRLGISSATRWRLTRPLILLFCDLCDDWERQHPGENVPDDQVEDVIKACIQVAGYVVPAVLSYDRFLRKDPLQMKGPEEEGPRRRRAQKKKGRRRLLRLVF